MIKTQSIASALLAALAISVFAQVQAPAGKARAQVKEETAEAIRTGNIVWGEEGRKLNEISPDRYPTRPTAPGETREKVKAELLQARKDGEIPEGEVGKTPRESYPYLYAAQPMEPGLTRSQVKAETLAAIRAGDVQIGELGKTLAEENPARYEGAPARPPRLSLHRLATAPSAAASESASVN